MQWCALPKEKRPLNARTQNQVAELLGVGPQTLSFWKAYPGFWEEVNREAKWLIGDSLPDIYEAMVKEALAGSVPAAKLCLQCLGIYEEKVQAPLQVYEPLVVIMNNHQLSKPEMRQLAGDDEIEGEFELVDGNGHHP